MGKKEQSAKRYVVGVLQEGGEFVVRLDSIRKNGDGDGDHLEAERWRVNGFLRADGNGRLVLESLNGELEADPDETDTANGGEQ